MNPYTVNKHVVQGLSPAKQIAYNQV